MSFETTVSFLTSAALYGERDDMSSPAARIVAGRAMGHGTASFDVMHDLNYNPDEDDDGDDETNVESEGEESMED